MTTADELQMRLRKENSRASRLKLDLHDLAEDLPDGWERIPEVAAQTHEAYQEVQRLAAALAALSRVVSP